MEYSVVHGEALKSRGVVHKSGIGSLAENGW